MRRSIQTVVLAVVLVLGTACGRQDKGTTSSADDTTQLQGSWTIEEYRLLGKTPEKTLLRKITVEGNKWTMTLVDTPRTMTFTLDPNKKPKQIDFAYTTSEGEKRVIPAIYLLSGDQLQVCIGLISKTESDKKDSPKKEKADDRSSPLPDRPIAFDSTTGVYMRLRQDAK